MPDLANRTDHERKLQAAILAVLARFSNELATGNPPNFAALETDLRRAIADGLTDVNREAFQAVWETLPDAPQLDRLDIDAPGREAAERHAAALAKAMADTRREQWAKLKQTAERVASETATTEQNKRTTEAVAMLWLIYGLGAGSTFRGDEAAKLRALGITTAPGLGEVPPGLRAEIPGDGRGWADTWLGRETADSIAITETTRAATMAERAAVTRYETTTTKKILAYWITERDARVCPICKPLNDKPETLWEEKFPFGPPAHPRCRCWLDWRDVT